MIGEANLSFPSSLIRILRQIAQQCKEGRRLTDKESHCG
jgi:hypothetical protein